MAKRTRPSDSHVALKLRHHGYDLNKVMFMKSGSGMHAVRAALLRGKINEDEETAVARLSKSGWNIDSVEHKAFKLDNGTLGFKTKARIAAEAEVKSKLAKKGKK